MAKLLERTIALEAGTSGEGNKFPKNDCGGGGGGLWEHMHNNYYINFLEQIWPGVTAPPVVFQ